MRLNEHTAVSTPFILLVPYTPAHVPTYHEWMKDEEIQELTASEPLSLEQEYEMCRTWRDDADKLTFICCLPRDRDHTAGPLCPGTDDAPERMVGDVNLFLSIQDDEDADGNVLRHCIAGEIELMIAPPPHRGKGLGRATLLAFLLYIRRHESEIAGSFLDAHRGEVGEVGEEIRIRVKIGKDNGKSLGLFKSAGFVQVREANYFGEVELSLPGGLEGVEAAEGWREERWETVS